MNDSPLSKNKNNYYITVITVAFNAEKYIEGTIENVLSQTCHNVEYIIIDGGSTDSTLNIIEKYQSKITYYLSEKDSGIYDAMNKGIAIARGEWVIFMNAGDIFYDANVLSAIDFKKFEDKLLIYGDALCVDHERCWLQKQENRHLDLKRSIIHQSIFYNAKYIKDALFKTQYRLMSDYDHLLTLTTKRAKLVKYIDRIVCIYDRGGVSSAPLYTYIREYMGIAWKHMNVIQFAGYLFYIFPRLIFSIIRR